VTYSVRRRNSTISSHQSAVAINHSHYHDHNCRTDVTWFTSSLDTASSVSAVALELEPDCILVLRGMEGGREGRRVEEEKKMTRKTFKGKATEV
jgi:hypothetical protein